MLASCTSEAVAFVKRHAERVVEVGAGDGRWARTLRRHGVSVKAFDIEPRGSGVTRGDHEDAAQHEGALLAIWPPDDRLWTWLAGRRVVITCGVPERFGPLDGLSKADEIELPRGVKGGNVLTAWHG